MKKVIKHIGKTLINELMQVMFKIKYIYLRMGDGKYWEEKTH